MTFYERYCALCAERGIKPHSHKTTDMIGITNPLVTAWKKGTMPRTETLEKLSRFFGVSIEYLVHGDPDRKYTDLKGVLNSDKSPEEKRELINNDPELTDFLQMLANREECRLLFHLSKDATREDVELAAKVIQGLRNKELK